MYSTQQIYIPSFLVLKYDNQDGNYIRGTQKETEELKRGMLNAAHDGLKKAKFDVTVENKNNAIYIDFKLK